MCTAQADNSDRVAKELISDWDSRAGRQGGGEGDGAGRDVDVDGSGGGLDRQRKVRREFRNLQSMFEKLGKGNKKGNRNKLV